MPVHVRTAGDGDKALVLLHPGPGLDGSVFFPWFEVLGDRFSLFAVDLACSGRSGGEDPQAWTIERQAALVDEVIGALGVSQPLLLGHSYGAFVALTHAVRFPGRCAGVIASCGAASEEVFDDIEARIDELDRPDVVAAFAAEETVETPEDCLAAWRGQLPFFVAEPDGLAARDLEEALGRVTWQPETVRSMVDESYDIREDIRAIETPILGIAGAEDRCTPPDATLELADLAPMGEAVVVERAGHFAYAEQPERYFDALTAWAADAVEP